MLYQICYFISMICAIRAFKYCIIGAGPGGVQMGYFFQKSNQDYVIFERSDKAGSFFEKYPRHGKLISINKRHTGSTNKEFNLRHDWNSLISDGDRMLFKEFSKEMFPPAESYVRYMNEFSKHFNLNIRYNTEVKNVKRIDKSGFSLRLSNNNTAYCNIVIVGTGLSEPNIPNTSGIELTEGYESISTNASDYDGQSVLILGRGNSAFETAQAIYTTTNYVHMIGRHRIRLAWETHYVGDIRAVNNEILDTYQLKSLDGLLEYSNLEDYEIIKEKDGLHLVVKNDDEADLWGDYFENDPLQRPYDKIIRCLGFRFDSSIYSDKISANQKGKYPPIAADYQSTEIPGLYVTGTAAHSLDHRKSAGGFIHGFRYTARALHNILSWRYEQRPWPKQKYALIELVPVITKRINEASGIYQMFGQLVDVLLLDGESFEYFEEFPTNLITTFANVTGSTTLRRSMIVVALEYGEDYHGPMEDIFREDRAATESRYAHLSNFLHPVLYYYAHPPNGSTTMYGQGLPRPDRILHLVEDFHTNWHHNSTHVQHLRVFLENCISQKLNAFQNADCLSFALTRKTVPLSCNSYVQSL